MENDSLVEGVRFLNPTFNYSYRNILLEGFHDDT